MNAQLSSVPLGSPWPQNAHRRDGVMQIGEKSVVSLAREFGTPSYILDVDDLTSRARAFKAAFDEAFGHDVAVYYASKAFTSRAVLSWLHAEGLRVDCSTAGELEVALAAGIPAADIGLHGNNKSVAELRRVLQVGVGRIIVDSLSEIELLGEMAANLQLSGVPVMVRLTTGVYAGGHDSIATAHEDQKFGLSIASGAARAGIEAIIARPELQLIGLHSHIGSQILATDGFVAAARAVLGFRAELFAEGIEIPEVDIGGGFGIAYLPGETDLEPGAAARTIAQVMREESDRLGVAAPEISIEPGRALVGPAMMTVYEVGTIKHVELADGTRTYVSVDGGMGDNIRPVLYDAQYTAALANRAETGPRMRSRIVGKHCESGDILIPNIELPADLQRGDLLVIAATGAYGRSLASNYNMVPRPGVVAVHNGEAREIVRRETIEDLLRLDIG